LSGGNDRWRIGFKSLCIANENFSAVGVERLAVSEDMAAKRGNSKPMSVDQFRAYEIELGNLTHGATAALLGLSEVAVKRYATGRAIPPAVAIALRALVLLHRSGKFKKLCEMP
jgi:hypothetical protein